MNKQAQLGERLKVLKAARQFARQSEASAYLRIRENNFGSGRQPSPKDRDMHAECNEALRIIQREVDQTRAKFLDTFYQ